MGRLIDADVLVETIADQIKANESDTSASGMAAKEVLKGFIGLVNGQPTASDWDRYSKKLWKEAYERGRRDATAQPERTCVNCGRTANNGGWYADGRTRCPIEEHYALPKDGFCHLWEKRNITDDDYPERREE